MKEEALEKEGFSYRIIRDMSHGEISIADRKTAKHWKSSGLKTPFGELPNCDEIGLLLPATTRHFGDVRLGARDRLLQLFN